jgi:hypothetical protein
VIIPAGGSLLGRALGPAPAWHDNPLWLPAGSVLAIERICRFYGGCDAVSEVLVVTDGEGGPPVDLHCLEGVRLMKVPPQIHICGTIAAALPEVDTAWVHVNPITTLPSRTPRCATELQVGAELRFREDWSALEATAGGGWRFIGKQEPPTEEGPTHPFTGILTAPAAVLKEVLVQLPASARHDLLAVAESLFVEHQALVMPTSWFDLGHRASVADSHRSRLPSRSFNHLRHCKQRDVIVKVSSDGLRLTQEAAYLNSLPPSLRRHFPALLPSEGDEAGALVMEAIPFPNLAELFLHWRIGPNAWLAILERLGAILAEFAAARPAQTGNTGWLYGTKLAQRWGELCRREEPASMQGWREAEMRINQRWYPSLERVVGEVLEALGPLQESSRLQLIHGDLCFNNILCDPLYTTVRLIDPRGEQPPGGIGPVGLGDSRYDLIKLNHSVTGLYDATVNNLFALRREGCELELQLYAPPNHAFLCEAFEERLLVAVPPQERRTLTTSLFLSMLPLHGEDPSRMLALAATGVLLWHDDLAGAVCR